MIVRHTMVRIDGKKVIRERAGEYHSLFILDDGSAYACGLNTSGQLGIGNTTNQRTPAKVILPTGRKAIEIGAGYNHSLFTLDDGSAYTCGSNSYGQLGIGNTTDQSTPQKVTLPTGRKAVAADGGDQHSLFALDDGSAYACGSNAWGQLGVESYDNQLTPVKVTLPIGRKAIEIGAGYTHSLFILDDDNAYACGHNGPGQLGIGNTTHQRTPAKVILPTGRKAIEIGAGRAHSLFILDDGSAYASGVNRFGQLGIGNTTDQSTPQKVTLPTGRKVIAVDAGDQHSLFILDDGSAYTCGSNNSGQLGTGNMTDQPTPLKVTLPIDRKAIGASGGGLHSLFLLGDDSAYASGLNNSGQLGTGNTTLQLTPVAVAEIRD